MTPDDERAADQGDRSSDAIERLVRMAGSRAVGDAEGIRRVRDAVHDAWQESILRRARLRRRTLGAVVLATAATVVVVVALARRPAPPTPAPAPTQAAARLTAATGPIGRLDDSRAALRVGDAAMVGAAFETGSGALAAFALTGGGELRMNEGTVVSFAGVREIKVDRGAIYLDSGPTSGSLVVRTPVGVVRDLGTRFEIGLVDGSWRVRVRDGLVRFDGGVAHQAEAGRELIVEPGGRVTE